MSITETVSQLTIPGPKIDPGRRLDLFAGYSFGWPACVGTATPYLRGCLTTPRYAARVAKEVSCPVMLDNGAWSDFVNSRHRLLMDVVEDLIDAYETIGPDRVRWVVAPDKVGRGFLSDRRACEGSQWLNAKAIPGYKVLWPIQEGMSLENPFCFYKYGLVGGFFIGGKTRRWKFEMSKCIRRHLPKVHIHIGRISSLVHLQHAVSIGVNSFDTTTYSRQNNWNRRQDFSDTLEGYCNLSDEEWISRVGYY